MGGFFENIFLNTIWFIFIQGPLNVISAFSQIINYLGGTLILKLLFGINEDWSFSGLPPAFFGLIGVGVIIGLIMFVSSLVVSQASGKDEEMKIKIINGFKFAVIGMSLIFLIPLMVLIFGLLLNALGTFIPQFFGSGSLDLGSVLYYIGSPNGIGPDRLGDFSAPDNIGSYNMIIQLIGVLFCLISFVLVGIQLVVKTIEIFILFVFSPVVAFSSVTDNGARIVILKNMILSKYLVVLIDIMGFFICVYLINQLLLLVNSIQGISFIGAILLQLFVVCGGATTMMSVSKLAGSFTGQETGMKETFAGIKSTIMGAGAVAFGAVGVGAKIAKGVTGIVAGAQGGSAGSDAGIIARGLNKLGGAIGKSFGTYNPEKFKFKQETKGMSFDKKINFAQKQIERMNNQAEKGESIDTKKMQVYQNYLNKSSQKIMNKTKGGR